MSSSSEVKKEDIIEDEGEDETVTVGVGEEDEDSFSIESHENLKGEIVNESRRWGIFVQFDVPNGSKSSTARLCPIRAYVNDKIFLSKLCPTERELGLVFPIGSKFNLDVERRVYSKKGVKEMDWIVKHLWKGDSKDLTSSPEKDNSFLARVSKAKEKLLDPSKDADPIQDEENEAWFISNLNIPKYLPHPSIEGAIRNIIGTVSSFKSPEGGIIKTKEGLEVYFHRCRVYYSKKSLKISAGTELQTVFKIGEEVRLDYIENKDKDGNPFMDIDQKYMALTVYSGDGPPPTVPEISFRKDPEEKYFIARIVSFDDPIDKSGVASGVAEILRPTERNTNGYVKSTFKKMVNLDPSVKKVKFNRNVLYHIGAPLVNADLQYFFSPFSYGLNIFFCYLSKLNEPEGDVTHEVSLGWKASTSFLHSTGRGALTIPPTVKEDTLLIIKSLSQCNTRFFGREGMDYSTYEKIIQGENGPYIEYYNGNKGCSEYVPARISELCFPPGKNEGVAKGFCILQSGVHKGKKVEFSRDMFSIFGFRPNEKTDLQYFIVLNEPCFVRLEDGDDLKINDLWIGAPRSTFLKNGESEMSYDKFVESEDHRIKFFLFLESHDLTLKDFDEVVKGKKPPRKFLPLSRESNRGVVIQLERALSKGKGRRLDLGAVSGVIKVENGPLAGQYVTFHRKNTWVMGYNMLKADLTHIFQEGQKVNLEAEELLSKEASRGPVPYEYKYRATLVWTSKFRPRNDLERTTPEDKRSHDWLKKRNLDSEKFQQLVNGKLPIVNAQFAAKNGNNMLKYRDILELASGRVQPDGTVPPPVTPEQLPVLRHGPEAARICEAALSTTGPNDQRIMDIIRNDDNAQMAFHIHKALGFALEYYTSNNSSSSFSMNELFSGNPQNGPFLSSSSNSSNSGNYRMNGGNSNNSFMNDNFQNFSTPSSRSLANGGNYNFHQQPNHQQSQIHNSNNSGYSSNNSIHNSWNNSSGSNNNNNSNHHQQVQHHHNSHHQTQLQQQQMRAIYPLMSARGGGVSSRGTKRQSDGNSSGYSPGMKKSRGVGGLRSGIRPLGGGIGGRGGMKNVRGGRGGRGGGGPYRN